MGRGPVLTGVAQVRRAGRPAASRHAAPRAAAVSAGARHDAGHLVGLERGPADERAVDRRLGQEFADIGRR